MGGIVSDQGQVLHTKRVHPQQKTYPQQGRGWRLGETRQVGTVYFSLELIHRLHIVDRHNERGVEQQNSRLWKQEEVKIRRKNRSTSISM